MNRLHQHFPKGAPRTQATTTIRAVIFYENRVAALHAKSALDHIAKSFQNEFTFETCAWSFGMFRASRLRDFVMRESNDADFVIISVEAPIAIPAEVMTGITRWCGLNGGKTAAIAFLTNSGGIENSGMSSIRYQLQLIAQEQSVEVLLRDLCSNGTTSEHDTRAFRRMILSPKPAIEIISEPGEIYLRWSINN